MKPRRKKAKPCAHCGVEFYPCTGHSKYCSQVCCGLARRRPSRVCLQCKQAYRPACRRSTSRFCSRLCRGQYAMKQRPLCIACGKPCNGTKRQFCSQACGSRYRVLTGVGFGKRGIAPVGATRYRDNGYIVEKRADGRFYWQHRLVMERLLGRPLLRSEHVHHLNGHRADNRPCNLELWHKHHPFGVRTDPPHVQLQFQHE